MDKLEEKIKEDFLQYVQEYYIFLKKYRPSQFEREEFILQKKFLGIPETTIKDLIKKRDYYFRYFLKYKSNSPKSNNFERMYSIRLLKAMLKIDKSICELEKIEAVQSLYGQAFLCNIWAMKNHCKCEKTPKFKIFRISGCERWKIILKKCHKKIELTVSPESQTFKDLIELTLKHYPEKREVLINYIISFLSLNEF